MWHDHSMEFIWVNIVDIWVKQVLCTSQPMNIGRPFRQLPDIFNTVYGHLTDNPQYQSQLNSTHNVHIHH